MNGVQNIELNKDMLRHRLVGDIMLGGPLSIDVSSTLGQAVTEMEL